MEVEIGIRNCARPVSFSTNDSKDSVSAAIKEALDKGTSTDLVDDKGRRIIVPGSAIGYAIVGSETQRPVGFGSLESSNN
jgi:hypothetical protein